MCTFELITNRVDDDYDDVCYRIDERPKLEGETENMGVYTKERKGVTAKVLMATPCTNSLGGESQKRVAGLFLFLLFLRPTGRNPAL